MLEICLQRSMYNKGEEEEAAVQQDHDQHQDQAPRQSGLASTSRRLKLGVRAGAAARAPLKVEPDEPQGPPWATY